MNSLASSPYLTQSMDQTHHSVNEPDPTQPMDGSNPCPSVHRSRLSYDVRGDTWHSVDRR